MQTDLPQNDPGLSLTDPAKTHLLRLLEQKSDLLGIRIGVKKAGCSGYEYTLAFARKQDQGQFDYVFDFEQFRILIDKEIYLKFFKGGTVMDYRKEGINEGIQFDNPNVGHQCGCGESFTLVDEDDSQ